MKPVKLQTKKAVIIIYPPSVPEEEKERILKRIAQIKKHW